MKKLLSIVILALYLVILSCNNSNGTLTNQGQILLENISKLNHLDSKGRLTILTTGYCAKNNCKTLFGNNPQVRFMSREEAFQYGIEKYLEIKSIDTDKHSATLIKRNGQNREEIQINF